MGDYEELLDVFYCANLSDISAHRLLLEVIIKSSAVSLPGIRTPTKFDN